MDLKANVNYNNSSACFLIHRDSPGVYHADLVFYDGDDKLPPPEKITLVRGVRQWRGSYEDVDLLYQLGKIIEEAYFNSSDLSAFK
jgi:hypothetical protein